MRKHHDVEKNIKKTQQKHDVATWQKYDVATWLKESEGRKGENGL